MWTKIIDLLILAYETIFKRMLTPQDGSDDKHNNTSSKAKVIEKESVDSTKLKFHKFDVEEQKPKFSGAKRLHVIDPGHVKSTPGKRSPGMASGIVVYEYELNHEIANRVGVILNVKYGFVNGMDYMITVPPTKYYRNTYEEIKDRMKTINNQTTHKEKIVYSIHHNAFGSGSQWTKPSGTETWYQRDNKKSKMVAALFQKNLVKALKFKDRGLKSAQPGQREFMIFRETMKAGIDCVLLELGFFTNLNEAQKLITNDYKDKAANAIAKTIAQLEGLKID